MRLNISTCTVGERYCLGERHAVCGATSRDPTNTTSRTDKHDPVQHKKITAWSNISLRDTPRAVLSCYDYSELHLLECYATSTCSMVNEYVPKMLRFAQPEPQEDVPQEDVPHFATQSGAVQHIEMPEVRGYVYFRRTHGRV